MDYDTIIEQLENLKLESDRKFVKDFITELEGKLSAWSPLIKRKYSLTDEERDCLLNVEIPGYKEELQVDKPSIKERPQKEKHSPEYYSYSYEDDDDEELHIPTWHDLNDEGLPYSQWLAKVGLPRFFPLPNPCLYKVAASICLINSASIPGMMRSLALQAELPLVICYGPPNAGKSTFCNWVGYHYSDNPLLTDDFSPFQVFKDDTSYKGLRDAFDRACRYDDESVREAACHIDDFEPRLLLSDGLWGKSRGIFIAIQKSQATSLISTNGSKSDVQGKFTYWLLKLISTNHHPKELFSALPKMERRCLVLPFEILSVSDNLGNYDWSVLRDEYMQLWNKNDRDSRFWRGLLRPQLRRPFSSFKYLTPDIVARSITVMCTGTFAGIWQDIDQAEKDLASYWEYVRGELQKGYQDFLLIALEDYVSSREEATTTGISRLDGRKKRTCTIALKDLLDKCSQSSNKDKDRERILSFMSMKGYTAISPVLGGQHTPSFTKELE